jgi:hypothetical protein
MYKVNFSMDKSPMSFFKILKTELEAKNFIKELGDRFISLKTI